MDENIGGKFSPLNVSASFSTTGSDPINKRRAQPHSAHQSGLKITLHAILIVGW
jgi:hypothetical protein